MTDEMTTLFEEDDFDTGDDDGDLAEEIDLSPPLSPSPAAITALREQPEVLDFTVHNSGRGGAAFWAGELVRAALGEFPAPARERGTVLFNAGWALYSGGYKASGLPLLAASGLSAPELLLLAWYSVDQADRGRLGDALAEYPHPAAFAPAMAQARLALLGDSRQGAAVFAELIAGNSLTDDERLFCRAVERLHAMQHHLTEAAAGAPVDAAAVRALIADRTPRATRWLASAPLEALLLQAACNLLAPDDEVEAAAEAAQAALLQSEDGGRPFDAAAWGGLIERGDPLPAIFGCEILVRISGGYAIAEDRGWRRAVLVVLAAAQLWGAAGTLRPASAAVVTPAPATEEVARAWEDDLFDVVDEEVLPDFSLGDPLLREQILCQPGEVDLTVERERAIDALRAAGRHALASPGAQARDALVAIAETRWVIEALRDEAAAAAVDDGLGPDELPEDLRAVEAMLKRTRG
jgi:hypothetical protein